MATLEQLAEAIKRADAAGNAEDVKKLGAAYRQMQAQTQQPAQPATTDPGFNPYDTGATKLGGGPGTPEGQYASALENVRKQYYPDADPATFAERSKQFYGPYDSGQLMNAGLTMGFADEAAGLGGAMGQLFKGKDFGQSFNDFKALDDARRKLGQAQQGGMGTAAELAGAVMSGGILNPANMAQAGGKLLPKIIQSAGESGVQGGLYGFGSTDGDLMDRTIGGARGAMVGAGVGAAVPVVGKVVGDKLTKVVQNRATTQAVKNAPDVADLKAAASNLFESSRVSKSGVEANTFVDFTRNLVQKAKDREIDPKLDGEAVDAYQRLIKMANDAMQSGGVTFSKLHNMRQIAQDVVINATKNRTKELANNIVDGLDSMIEGLKPGQIMGQGGKQAGNDLLEGISIWSRAKKLGVIEEAITKAGYMKSGTENGLRLQFLSILRDPRKRKLFSATELAEIEKVAKGTAISNLTTLLGKFGFSSSGNGLGGFLGGTAGLAMGGPLGAILTAGAASGARKLSEKMAEGAANRTARVIATPNIPQIAPIMLPKSETLLKLLGRGVQPMVSGQ